MESIKLKSHFVGDAIPLVRGCFPDDKNRIAEQNEFDNFRTSPGITVESTTRAGEPCVTKPLEAPRPVRPA